MTNILSTLEQALYMIPVLLISLTVHEFSHGYAAYKLGDPTAKNAGRLTLNPLKHLDPIGTLMMLVAHIGWAKPVPVNPRNFANPKHDMVKVGIAGPLSNIMLAFIFVVPMYVMNVEMQLGNVGEVGRWFFTFFYLMYRVNLTLAIFNLLPIPPLDGSKVFGGILPDRYYYKMMQYERYIGIAFLLIIVFEPGILSGVFEVLSKPFDLVFSAFGEWIIKVAYF